MRKRLDLDSLAVDTFTTLAAAPDPTDTVVVGCTLAQSGCGTTTGQQTYAGC